MNGIELLGATPLQFLWQRILIAAVYAAVRRGAAIEKLSMNRRAPVRIALGPQSDSKSGSQLQPRESATYSHLIGNTITRLLIDSRKL